MPERTNKIGADQGPAHTQPNPEGNPFNWLVLGIIMSPLLLGGLWWHNHEKDQPSGQQTNHTATIALMERR